jgi:hypothetical protein
MFLAVKATLFLFFFHLLTCGPSLSATLAAVNYIYSQLLSGPAVSLFK